MKGGLQLVQLALHQAYACGLMIWRLEGAPAVWIGSSLKRIVYGKHNDAIVLFLLAFGDPFINDLFVKSPDPANSEWRDFTFLR